MKPDICIFHGPACLDGFTAAWAIWKRWPDVEFVAANYGQDPPDVTGKHVLIVDFSYKRPVLMHMARTAASITVLDHHKTAQEDLAPYQTILMPMDILVDTAKRNGHAPIQALFDMTKSGAMLAWEYAHPGNPAPYLVLSVQDRDLWKFELPETRELAAVMFSHDYSFELWDDLEVSMDVPLSRAALALQGEGIKRAQMKDIRQAIKSTMHIGRIAGYDVPIANLPYQWASEAGNIMAEGYPFAAAWYEDGDCNVRFSLRAAVGGSDVAKVAELFGGGGHKSAAGFSIIKGDAHWDAMSMGKKP